MSAADLEVAIPESGPSQIAPTANSVGSYAQKPRINEHSAMCIDTESQVKVQDKSPPDNTSEGPASNKSSEKMECSPGSEGTQPSNAIRKSSTTTVGKFKEKRPEPLKLNPTLNQDIPLDLSVKSAGNVPSGTLSNIFNLGLTSHMTTLETPRIQWQDNDALLSTGTNLRSSSNIMPHSASLVLESPSSFAFQRAQILDRWTKINQLRADLINGPRRSCSSDNLSSHAANDKHMTKTDRLRLVPDEKLSGLVMGPAQINKKSSISPLATKSLSNTQNNTRSQNKFSYTTSQTTLSINDSQQSPTTDQSGKSLTPTSLANATTNLLNIHLNSPTGASQSPVTSAFDLANLNANQRSPYKSPSFSSFDQEISPLDPLISATFCQQHQFNTGTSSINFSSPTSSSEPSANFHRNMIAFQHQNLPSISGSATLNTPTLISPSQGQLCFLQSPTLSPMSSVFDLPSPFLMFPPSSQSQFGSSSSKQFSPKSTSTTNDKSRVNDQAYRNGMQVDQKGSINNTISLSCDALKMAGYKNDNAKMTDASSANDLSHLITSAAEKFASSTQAAEQHKSSKHTNRKDSVETEMDCDIREIDIDQSVSNKPRPATTIPQICISNHHLEAIESSLSKSNENMQPLCNRSLSPASFRAQVHTHRNERLESSSAPPDVYQRRARSKIKTITADSCIDITYKNRASGIELDRVFSGSTSNITAGLQNGPPLSNSNLIQNRLEQTNPGIREWFPASGHPMHAQACINGSGSHLSARSNSAEPALHKSLLSKRSGLQSSFATDCNDAGRDCCQLEIQSSQGTSLSSSAGQLHCGQPSQVARPMEQNSLNQNMSTTLNHSAMNVTHHRHQYNPAYTYHQDQASQQHSSSSGELSRLANNPVSWVAANINANGQNIVNPRQSGGHFHKVAQENEQDFMRQNGSGISSSLNRVDYLLNECHQTQVDSRRSTATGTLYGEEDVMMREASDQTSVINLLCNNETCQRQALFVNNLQRSYTTSMATPLTMPQYNQHPSLIAGEISTSAARMRGTNNTVPTRSLCQADLETRSESRSSNSLDFCSQFLDGNSRPSSEASSNMTSKKYHCDQCSKSFTRSDMLTRHRRLHSGDRPFQCGECKQEFSRSDHLSTHMRTHTGEKPYKCKLCSYSACRKDMITRHLKVHSRSPHSNDFI